MKDTLEFVHEDEFFLVVNKPAKMLSVPGRGPENQDCLISRVQRHFPEALSVHRLDYATSGLIIVARSKDVHRQLSILFEQRKIEKSYTAIVSGIIEDDAGSVDLPLICDWPNRPLQKVDMETGKPSRTLYQCVERNQANNSTRVILTPVTGRSHQLRVHMQQLGHPILGDQFYAPEPVRNASPFLCLHATQLSFTHPVTNSGIKVVSEPKF
ncbi:pseudouridine synthase [Simiduia curdlanivorans]|uniref:Dual-specificity RNA pseudouridine synthase RluA n=1 Tax=Simiduia curdlanivorans TaxID=1492769 RepID=A0ABV8V9M8_9GAMM|nr:pseudouridine synthase [Simiduia curdlanivorans]MDN3639742.1 pseudouridine synthase [Simiduia curdlanivorans]